MHLSIQQRTVLTIMPVCQPGDALQTHLAKLHIRSVFSEQMKILSENNLKKIVKDEKKSRDIWVERVRQGEHFNDIVQEILIRP